MKEKKSNYSREGFNKYTKLWMENRIKDPLQLETTIDFEKGKISSEFKNERGQTFKLIDDTLTQEDVGPLLSIISFLQPMCKTKVNSLNCMIQVYLVQIDYVREEKGLKPLLPISSANKKQKEILEKVMEKIKDKDKPETDRETEDINNKEIIKRAKEKSIRLLVLPKIIKIKDILSLWHNIGFVLFPLIYSNKKIDFSRIPPNNYQKLEFGEKLGRKILQSDLIKFIYIKAIEKQSDRINKISNMNLNKDETIYNLKVESGEIKEKLFPGLRSWRDLEIEIQRIWEANDTGNKKERYLNSYILIAKFGSAREKIKTLDFFGGHKKQASFETLIILAKSSKTPVSYDYLSGVRDIQPKTIKSHITFLRKSFQNNFGLESNPLEIKKRYVYPAFKRLSYKEKDNDYVSDYTEHGAKKLSYNDEIVVWDNSDDDEDDFGIKHFVNND